VNVIERVRPGIVEAAAVGGGVISTARRWYKTTGI